MYFLNPAILVALTAISIPVVIHLFNLQKIRKVEFSTLMFLKELQKSKIKRIKLKQLLLLLLRIMVIVFLVLSFAKPVYKGYAGAGSDGVKKTVVVILDNSFSMSASDSRGNYLQQAKDAISRIIASHSESDEIYFIPSSEILFKDRQVFYSSKNDLIDSLNNVTVSYKPASVSEQMNLAAEKFSASVNQINELFIISDFQRSNFNTQASSFAQGNNFENKNLNLFLINIRNENINNISIDSIEVISKILEKNREIKMKLVINNNSDFSVTNKIVNLHYNGIIAGEKALDINSREKAEVEFSFNPSGTGYINGYFELVRNDLLEDELTEDNKFYFTLYIPEKFRIGFVEGSSAGSNYIELAYSTAQDLLRDHTGETEIFFELNNTGITPAINNYDLLIINGKQSISNDEAELLLAYISNGGGLLIFPDESIDINSYNNFLSKVNASKLGNINQAENENQNLKFDKVDFGHPVLSEVFQNRNLNLTHEQVQIESPSIKKYFDILTGDGSMPIITLSNGKPFLVSSRHNNGSILLFSVSAGTDLSDLPVKSIFLPLIIRSTYYLGSSFDQKNDNYAGKNNLIRLPGNVEIVSIKQPSGSEIKFNSPLKSNRYFNLPYDRQTSHPGIYSLVTSGENEIMFSLNHNPDESITEKMTESELEDFFDEMEFENVYYLNSGENVTLNVTQARTGLELWKYFLLAALMFLALELFLSKRMEKE